MFELFRACAEGAAVVGSWDFPQDCIWGVGVVSLRVADGDVAVDLAVDQEDWDCRCGGGIFGRDVVQVEVILQAHAEEGDFD